MKNTPNMLCCPFFNSEDLFATALAPFFLLLCLLCGPKNDLSRITWASLFIMSVSKFHNVYNA